MNLFKKTVISILATLPLGAISYAAEFESNIEINKDDIKAEFERRLAENELPEKYYSYLERQDILNMDELVSEKNLTHYLRMLREFENDNKGIIMAVGGSISIGGTF